MLTKSEKNVDIVKELKFEEEEELKISDPQSAKLLKLNTSKESLGFLSGSEDDETLVSPNPKGKEKDQFDKFTISTIVRPPIIKQGVLRYDVVQFFHFSF